jgi:Na+/melibiose symporter-like transporter
MGRRDPMLDPRLFARRGFAAGSLSAHAAVLRPFGLLFIGLQYLQLVLGYSPIEAGASILPMALMLVLIAPRAPRIAARLGVRAVGGAGLAVIGAGFLIFASLGPGSSYPPFGLAALVTGIGIGLATAPATTAIVSSLPAERQGIASAVNDLTREVGGAFGIAVLGSVLNNGYRDHVAPAAAHLPAPAAGAVRSSVAAAGAVAARTAPTARRSPTAHRAFVSGFSTALIVAACVLFAAGLVVALVAPPRRRPARRRRQPHGHGVPTT